MSRSAAYVGSTTGHGGNVIEGSVDVVINGKPAIGVGHPALCPKHGKSAVATGREDVLVNGVPMARLLDKVLCAGARPPGPGGALVDHGPPARSSGDYDIYLDGSLVDYADKDAAKLVEGIKEKDETKIREALRDMDAKAGGKKGSVKVVDRNDPNTWYEAEASDVGAQVNQDPLAPWSPRVDQKPGGGRLRAGGQYQGAGAKVTRVERYRHDDGSIRERRYQVGVSEGEGALIDAEWSDSRKGINIDGLGPFGVSGEDIVIDGAIGQIRPALDDVLFPASPDVFLGD